MHKDGCLSYDHYTQEELEQAWAAIDARAYPANHASLCREFAARGLPLPTSATAPGPKTPPPSPEAAQNAIIGAILVCLMFVAAGVYGIAQGDLRFSWRNRELVSGDAAWVFLAAVLVCLLGNGARLAGMHMDGDREHLWRSAGNVLLAVGVCGLLAAFILDGRQP